MWVDFVGACAVQIVNVKAVWRCEVKVTLRVYDMGERTQSVIEQQL